MWKKLIGIVGVLTVVFCGLPGKIGAQTVNVDAATVINPFNKHMLGVAHGNWDFLCCSKPFPGAVPGLDTIYKAAHIGLLRYAGGNWANSVGWERSPQKSAGNAWTPNKNNYDPSYQNLINTSNTYYFHYGQNEIDSLALLAKNSGADVLIQMDVSKNDPYMWADLVKYSKDKGYNFKYWEIGNEIDHECTYGDKSNCMTPAEYKTRAQAYITEMKKVDPSIVIVGGVSASGHDNYFSGSATAMSQFLTAAKDAIVGAVGAGAPNHDYALSYHWYTDCNATNYNNVTAYQWSTTINSSANTYGRAWSKIGPARVQSEIINPSGLSMEQGVTELNTDACDNGGNGAPAYWDGNHMAALWYADNLGRFAYNGTDFVTWYEGYGRDIQGYPSVGTTADNPTSVNQLTLRPPYYTDFLYGNFFGDQMVSVSDPSPTTFSVWAATDTRDPGKLKLMVTNISGSAISPTIAVSGFTPVFGVKYVMISTAPTSRTYSTSTINGISLAANTISNAAANLPKVNVALQGNNVTETFPAYSVTAIVLSGGPSTTLGISPSAQPSKSGDANNDGKVDGLDYVIWLNNYGAAATGPSMGDFNGDKKVDGLDYVVWLNNYGK